MYYQVSEISRDYPGLKVTWRDHVKLRISKAHSSFYLCCRCLSNTRGLMVAKNWPGLFQADLGHLIKMIYVKYYWI